MLTTGISATKHGYIRIIFLFLTANKNNVSINLEHKIK